MNEELADNPRNAAEDSDHEGESEAVDYRFLSSISKKDCTIPARGEKDFEPDGTNKQTRTLQSSRDAMHEALSVERDLSSKNYIRAIWHSGKALGRVSAADTRGTMFKSIGKTDRDGNTWLLPEELLFMVERGNIECFYEHVAIGMSLQAAYAECIPHIGVDEFQVYTYLKRAGYMVLRTRPLVSAEKRRSTASILYARVSASLQRLQAVISDFRNDTGPLNSKQVYRSYKDVYRRLNMVPCHTFTKHVMPPASNDQPLKITFDIWKPNTNFKKSAPGRPDFRIAVLNSRDYGLCSITQLDALFATLEDDETYDKMSQFTKLKVGKRHCILAIADLGVISFMSLGDVSFGSESVYTPWQATVDRHKRRHNQVIKS